jgi:glycosyltransferase involved in cell wall biosynthesis
VQRPSRIRRDQFHICFISTLHSPTDKRVHYKEATSLTQAGFRVSHVARDEDSGTFLDGVEQIPYPAGGRSIGDRLKRFWLIYRLAKGANADVYHCNETDSWVIGIFLTLFSRARLVHDVHEIYSSNLAERHFPRWAQPIIVALIRTFFLPLTLMTDAFVYAKKSVEIDYPIARKSKVIVVANYVELPKPLSAPVPNLIAPHWADNGPITILHLGAINRERGWPQMLEALNLTQNERLHLRVLGRFGDGSDDEFLKTAERLGLKNRVSFSGQVPYVQVPEEVARADIGVIAFQPVMLNFTHALPHKLFDYMLGELPVVVPDFAIEVEHIVRTSDCGLAVPPEDPGALANAFDRLAGDSELRRRLGENGRCAVLERYNWSAEAEKLIDFYDTLTGAAAEVIYSKETSQ